MPKFETQVPHKLGKQQATERIKRFVEDVRKQYEQQVSGLDGSWEDSTLNFCLTTYGFKIKGTLQVDDERAVVSGNLPLAALPFRHKIEQSIAKELQQQLV